MSRPTPQEALKEVRSLLPAASGPSSTSDARRKFFTLLIELCSYPSYECKAFFGTLVAKHFAEFEDLQDQAVDAILDLCEDDDEKTRLIGIKGLAATGKADPKWVKGNTGVLLQLLECPPRELQYVRDALGTLLNVAPSEVFGVMIDDLKAAEEQTGASRRNVLDYIGNDAADARRRILESGDDLEAEDAFREGLVDTLERLSKEQRFMVLGWLIPLSTIGGTNSTPKICAWFCKILIDTIPSDSSTKTSEPLVILFDEWCKRNTPLDPRYGFLFLAAHGAAVIELAHGGNVSALDILTRSRRWVDGAMDRWAKGRKDEDREISEDALVKRLSRALLGSLLDLYDSVGKGFEGLSTVSETVLWLLYRFLTIRDRRRDIRSSDAKELRKFSDDADDIYQRDRDSLKGRTWKNVRDMADVLRDPAMRPLQIQPTWTQRPIETTPAAPPRGSSIPSGPKNAFRPPAGPRAAAPASPQRPPTPPPAPKAPSSPSAPRPNTPPLHPMPSSPAQKAATTVRDPPKTQQATLISKQLPTGPSGNRLKIKASNGAARSTEPSHTVPPITDHTTATITTSNGVPKEPVVESSNRGKEIFRSSAVLPVSSSENSQRGKEILKAPSGPPSSTEGQSSQLSLAERLGLSAKRPRDEPAAQGTPRSSLLSRMSERMEEPDAKKAKPSTPTQSSLLSRMGLAPPLSSGQNGAVSQISSQGETSSQARPLSIRSKPTPTPTQPQLSIRNAESSPAASLNIRKIDSAASTLTIRRSTPTPTPTLSTPSLNIRDASKSETPERPVELIIRSRSTDNEDGVIRKGRGFQKQDEEDNIIMAPIVQQSSATPSISVIDRSGGSLQARLGLGRTVGRKGR